ncbi:hypothetical protein M885DRAFT_561692 [Pelagophyceae sp. CCMP2097]|nr:hypothetical protein M885DRAFT_561692 [Pelagophyceae sp. CCMP2097]
MASPACAPRPIPRGKGKQRGALVDAIVDAEAAQRLACARLGVRLLLIDHAHTAADLRCAVAKLAAAPARAAAPAARGALAPANVRAWVRREYSVDLHAAAVGAVVDLLPDYCARGALPGDASSGETRPASSAGADCAVGAVAGAAGDDRRVDAELLGVFVHALRRTRRHRQGARPGDGAAQSQPGAGRGTSALLRSPSEPARTGVYARGVPHRGSAESLTASVTEASDDCDDDEFRAFPRAMVKLLAAALQFDAGLESLVAGAPCAAGDACTACTQQLMPAGVFDDVLARHLGVKLSLRERRVARDVCGVSGRAWLALGGVGDRKAFVRPDKLVTLLRELRRAGLRGSVAVLLGSCRVSLRALRLFGGDANVAAALQRVTHCAARRCGDHGAGRLRAVERALVGIAASARAARSTSAVAEELRCVCLANADLVAAEAKAAQRRDGRRRTSMGTLLQAAFTAELSLEAALEAKPPPRAGPRQSACWLHDELAAAHRERAEATVLRGHAPERRQAEGRRLRRFQAAHLNAVGGAVVGAAAVAAREWRPHEEPARCAIARASRCWLSRLYGRRLRCATRAWQHALEARCADILARLARTARVRRMAAAARQSAHWRIYRALRRNVYMMRARREVLRRRSVRRTAERAQLATAADRQAAATVAQGLARGARLRATHADVTAFRDETRCVRVDVVRACGLRPSRAALRAPSDGAGPPQQPGALCYVCARLGDGGSFAVLGMGPSKVTLDAVDRAYAFFEKQRLANVKARLAFVAGDATVKRRQNRGRSPEGATSSASSDDLFSLGRSVMSVAGMSATAESEARQPRSPARRPLSPVGPALPPSVRWRDFDKYVLVPPRHPVFFASTRAAPREAESAFGETFTIHGVDSTSHLYLTLSSDTGARPDARPGDARASVSSRPAACLGQAAVPLASLGAVDTLARRAAKQRAQQPPRRTSLRANAREGAAPVEGAAPGLREGASPERCVLVGECALALGPPRLPVVAMDGSLLHLDAGAGAAGLVWCRVWASPWTESVCSYLEQRAARGLVHYWTARWCVLAFGTFLVFNRRGDVEPAHSVAMDHVDTVDIARDFDDGDVLSLAFAGGPRLIFRGPDVGLQGQAALFRKWVRRLRRAAPRIPTNERAPSDCTHKQYTQPQPG